MSKISNLDLNKRGFFSNFGLYSKGSHFSITRFDILIFCNLLHPEMNFAWKFALKNDSFFYKVFDKSLVKTSYLWGLNLD